MRKRRITAPVLVLGALLGGVLAGPTAAAPPERFEERFTILFPDFDRELVILVNTTRDEFCTPAVVDWEVAVSDWIEDYEAWVDAGSPDPPGEPPFPADPAGGFPAGNDPITTQLKETGQGALVFHQVGRGLDAEIWPMVQDPPGIGPCTDTDPGDTPLVGTARYQGSDNDLFGTGTRGNAFGDQGRIVADGHTYAWRFHVNSRCYAPEDGPPRCEMYRSSFR